MARLSAEGAMVRSREAAGSIYFDWWMAILCAWMLVGLYLDGWAHRHLHNLDSFFTPWHAVLYSGFIAVTALICITLLRNHANGYPLQLALPAGYGLSMYGVLIFVGGGIGDLIWHTVFGIEADLELLLNPTHLILATGGAIIAAGPLRAEWQRTEPESAHSFLQFLPMLLSLTFVLSVFTFMTQFAHPFVYPWAEGPPPDGAFFPQALGLVSILLQTCLMMGFILLAVWRWVLPPGSLPLVLTLNAALMSFLVGHYYLIPVGLVAGVIADVLLQLLNPSALRPTYLRLFGFTLPIVFYASYFLFLKLASGVWWSIHLWTGSIVLAGIVGWLLSYLLIPPGAVERQAGGH